MKAWIKEYWGVLAAISGGWFALGFMLGAMETAINRDAYKPEERRSGCVYRSIAALVNPGYVAACELFRKRFELEGFGAKK